MARPPHRCCRWLGPTLAAVVALPAAEAAPAVELLTSQGAAHAAVLHAVARLSAGDPSALNALDPSLLGQPFGIAEPGRPGLLRRWTWALGEAVRRLDDGRRKEAEAVLAGWLHRGGGLAAAIDALPAPAAVRVVAAEAERAFDRGAFVRWRDLAGLLTGDDPLRRSVAARELDGAPIVLPAPPVADGPAPEAGATTAATFAVLPGWLVRRDPLGRTAWQLAVGPGDRVAWDPGLVAIRTPSELHLLDAGGRAAVLPPVPPRFHLAGVAGGAAWLIDGRTAWRVEAGGTTIRIGLPFTPLDAPLARGDQALWLGHRELALTRGDAVAATVLHGLPAGEGWCWIRGAAVPRIGSPDGRAWTLPPLEPTLATLAPAARLTLLDRLGLGARAARIHRDLRAAGAAPADEDAALRSLFAVAAPMEELEPLATGPGRRALVWRWRQLHGPMPAEPAPEAAVPGDPADLALPPAVWRWRMEPAVWRRPRPRPAAAEAPVSLGDPVPATGPVEPVAARLARFPDRIELDVADPQGPRWSRRLEPPAFLAAPAVALEPRPPWLLVESAGRVRAFWAGDGHEEPVADPPSPPPVAACHPLAPGSGTQVALVPLGVGTSARWLSVDGLDATLPLPVPARWVLGVPDGSAWVGQQPGHALRLHRAGLEVLASDQPVPAEWSDGEPPVALGEGVVHGGRCWPWRR